MFKVPKPEDRQTLIAQYGRLSETNVKVVAAPRGLPTSSRPEADHRPRTDAPTSCLNVGEAQPDARPQGFTLVCETEFATLNDKYYNDECPAHRVLKAVAKGLAIDGVMTVYFRPSLSSRHDQEGAAI